MLFSFKKKQKKPIVNLSDLSLVSPITVDEQNKFGFKLRKDCNFWKYKIPINWSVDPFNDRNWCFQLHAWRMLDPLLREYRKDGDNVHLLNCLEFVKDWEHYHRTRKAKMSWYDMATGIRAAKIAYLLDRHNLNVIQFKKSDLRILRKLARQHLSVLTDKNFISYGNHAYFQLAGLKCLAQVFKVPLEVHEFANTMMQNLISSQFTTCGLHKEHSPSYHNFTISMIRKLRIDKNFPQVGADQILKLAGSSCSDFVMPDGSIIPIGDSFGKEEKPRSDNQIKITNRIECGYCSVRSSTEMMFVTGMAYSELHKHADDLSFVLFCDDQHVFIDSGKYGYQRDDWRDYFVSADAHNTISVLEQRVGPKDVVYEGSLLNRFEQIRDTYHISGIVRRPGLFEQTRAIEYKPGEKILICDNLKSCKQVTYASNLHLAEDLIPEPLINGFQVMLKSGRLISATASNVSAIEFVRGGKEPIVGWSSSGYLQTNPISTVRAIVKDSNQPIVWQINLNNNRVCKSAESELKCI
ncbi:alginate lyase family protein [Pseudovibrio sp. WM33]|uniref:alginate lyase family protein n=1 Tax=Pseudovibrio sp. WM33 TaxID=1735585 RepID=UPI0007AE6F23|nr:alginate lyase family protein [Pseudovibrio sp. WM33]KZL24980.1 Heparinase II/III-like protein [Pseudovibrio sp. WM33]